MSKENVCKQTKKYVFRLCMSVLIMVGVMFAFFESGDMQTAYASEADTKSSEYTYNIMYHNDNTEFIVITSYEGSESVVRVPEKIDGYIVERIGAEAFSGNKDIQEVILPETVNYIDRYAFQGCSSLKKIDIPDDVTYIGVYCFAECTSLESITLPKNITSIEGYMFYNCIKLEKVDIPDSVTLIDDCAFQQCISLKDVNLSASLEVACEDAFRDCSSLATLELPYSLTKMETTSLFNTSIKTLKVPNPNAEISVYVFDGELNKENDYTIIGAKGSKVEKFAKDNFMLFKSLDGTYECDYREVDNCYDNACVNYNATIAHLNEYYLQKYPQMALGLTYSTQSEREFFKNVAQTIIDSSPEVEPAVALYNWMNKNILSGDMKYGYPMDVYNFRSADCLGNALLLCEMLRSVGIPAVTTYGYACDTKKVDETFLAGEIGHAWVMAYYNNQWNLLDSAMDKILTDEEEICRWYYTMAINNYYQVYNDEYNSKLSSCLIYFKDGKYVIYRDAGMLNQNMSESSIHILEENVYYLWKNFHGKYADETFVEDGSLVEGVPGKEGLITDGGFVYYMNMDSSIRANMFIEDGNKLYYANQHGILFDFTELKDECRIKRGIPVINKGTEFKIKPLGVADADINGATWTSENEEIAVIDENGNLKALQTGYVSFYGEVGNKICFFEVFIDELVTEIALETYLELNIGKKATLKPEVNSESQIFGNYIWQSSDESVVTVDNMGNITAIKEGVADVSVLYGDGSGLNASCRVKVLGSVIPDGLNKGKDGVWYYYKNNFIDKNYVGLAKNKYGWWYVENGKIDMTYTGLVKYKSNWVYVVNGKLNATYTGLVKYKSNWVYVNKGKLDAAYTGLVKYKSNWVYVVKGKLNATYTGLVKYKSSWVYVNKGKLDATYTGMAKNQYGWWYVTKGKLDLTFTGIAKNAYGTWYLQKGKLDLTFSVKVTVDGKTYKIKNGKVK